MGDYWTVSAGMANHTGHTCRECRRIIYANTPIYVRDGRKIRLFYHEACFSGNSDPRTQNRSSANERWDGISPQAPRGKGYGKWWTSSYGYSGDLNPTKRNSASSGVRSQNHALKGSTGNILKQRSVSLLVRSTDADGSSSSTTHEKPNNTYSEGIGWKNMTPRDRDTDKMPPLDPKESPGSELPGLSQK